MAADDSFVLFYIYLSKKIRPEMSYHVLISLKNNEKIFKTVICSSDWVPKG